MAITPRSFVQNPKLLVVMLLGAFGLVAALTSTQTTRLETSDCPSAESAVGWALCVEAELDAKRYHRAYNLAGQGLQTFPNDAQLLNQRGFAAARSGDHRTAALDFKTGLQRTGSPTGVFENNIAWSRLYALDGVAPRQALRVLSEMRDLYEVSLTKGTSCERLHTAMFVEYAIADLTFKNKWHGVTMDATRRYQGLHQAYQPCLDRIEFGDDLVVEEVASAAIMDLEMGRMNGVVHPTRHQESLRRSVVRALDLGLVVDGRWCEQAVPVRAGAATCARLAGTESMSTVPR